VDQGRRIRSWVSSSPPQRTTAGRASTDDHRDRAAARQPAGWLERGRRCRKTITVYVGDMIKNGTTEQTMSIEQQYQDLVVPEYDYLTGMAVDELSSRSSRARSSRRASPSWARRRPTRRCAPAGATDIAAPTNDVLSSSANVGHVPGQRRLARRSVGGHVVRSHAQEQQAPHLGDRRRRQCRRRVGDVPRRGEAQRLLRLERDPHEDPRGHGQLVRDAPRRCDGAGEQPGLRARHAAHQVLGRQPADARHRHRPHDRPRVHSLAHPTLGYAFSVNRLEEYYP
jgi:hypothetical protein